MQREGVALMRCYVRWWVAVGLLGALVLGVAPASAQVRQYASGQTVVPVYEGWEKNVDGSFNLVFGYFNRNWEESLDIPTGPNNFLEPGVADQGQPTRFYPRRSQFIFRVRVPADFGDQEVVWTLSNKGEETLRAYATLLPEYFIDKLVISANTGGAGGAGGGDPALHTNEPPTLQVEGGTTRTVTAGDPVVLIATARDDGVPTPRPMFQTRAGVSGRPAPDSATGLRVSWFVYRGAGQVTFDPPQITEWVDSRAGANAPMAPGWSTPETPVDNQWVVRATFAEPGTYVLRAQAHDGALPVAEDITFTVNP